MSEEGTSSPSSSFGSDTLIDSEIDFTKTSFDVGYNITDSDLFKYFLSDDLVEGSNHELLSITSHTFETNDSPNQSPQPSPPQLSPELNDFGLLTDTSSPTQISVFDTNLDEVPLIPIKQEGTPTIIPPTKKSSRKRERPAKDPNPALADVAKLNRGVDSSVSISNKPVSVDEEKQLKRQKRLIKNRESAQLSRLRKKIYIEELERKVGSLTTDAENLTKQVTQLQADKKKLQGEVVYLQSIIKQSPELSATLSKRASSIPAKNMKAAGVCLLIVLFSVGLLFNSKDNDHKLFKNTSNEDIPSVVTTKTTRSVYTGRVLKSIEDNKYSIASANTPSNEDNKIISSIKEPVVKTETSSTIVPRQYKHSIALSEEEEEDQESEVIRIEDNKMIVEATSTNMDRRKRQKIKSEDEGTIRSSSSSMELVTTTLSGESLPSVTSDVILTRNPSSSYIYCPEAHHIAPSSSSSGASEMIALLIPASVLNSTLTGNHTLDTSLLEISCSILNLHMWPLNNRAN